MNLTTVTLNRQPALPPITGNLIQPGLAVIPDIDQYGQFTGLYITVHTASGNTIGGPMCATCRYTTADLYTGIDWTRNVDQLRADPLLVVINTADLTNSDRCTANMHDCTGGTCIPIADLAEGSQP